MSPPFTVGSGQKKPLCLLEPSKGGQLGVCVTRYVIGLAVPLALMVSSPNDVTTVLVNTGNYPFCFV